MQNSPPTEHGTQRDLLANDCTECAVGGNSSPAVDSTAKRLPMSTPQILLERYVEAKDLVRPHLMQQIYAADAVLTFSIATDSITFPARVAGIDGITQTLVVDFGAKYSRCKTYCVCDSPPRKADKIAILPWLVLMREPARACLRVGQGYYEWAFAQRGQGVVQAVAMHIYIGRMEAIDDADGHLLSAAQSVLPYPWLPPKVMASEFEALAEADPALAFLKAFEVPLDPATCGQTLSGLARR